MKSNNKPDKEMLNRLHKDPENWKFGIFYFNKNDPRIFVPKLRPELGLTLNFGNTYSFLILVGFIILLIGFVVLFK